MLSYIAVIKWSWLTLQFVFDGSLLPPDHGTNKAGKGDHVGSPSFTWYPLPDLVKQSRGVLYCVPTIVTHTTTVEPCLTDTSQHPWYNGQFWKSRLSFNPWLGDIPLLCITDSQLYANNLYLTTPISGHLPTFSTRLSTITAVVNNWHRLALLLIVLSSA